MPRQSPRNGMLFSRAYCIAAILPSIPRSPNPPGTSIPLTSPRTCATFPAVSSSEGTHFIFTLLLWAKPPCFNDSTTLIYASWSEVYLPTSATLTSLSRCLILSTISCHSVISGSGHSRFNFSHTTSARCSFSIARGAS